MIVEPEYYELLTLSCYACIAKWEYFKAFKIEETVYYVLFKSCLVTDSYFN